MKKTTLRILYIFVFLFAFSVFLLKDNYTPPTFAASIQENKNAVSKLEDSQKSKQSDIAALQREIDQAKSNVNKQANVKHLLDKQIATIQEEIEITKELIGEYKEQIKFKEDEISSLNSDINDAVKTISDRLVIQHETGNSSMISFILGSDNFAEMLTRIEIARELFEYDQEIINDLENDRTLLESANTELKTVLEKCEATERELSVKEGELETKASDATAYLLELQKDKKALEESMARKEAELNAIQNEIKALLTQIAIQEREDYSNDEFRFPLSYDSWYYCTGGFGTRYWKDGSRPPDFHKGVDYAAYYGTPIYAVNSGTVTISRLSPSFGNYVVIDHGGGISSLYAHASARYVEVGDIVVKGDKIAAVGSTGDSTGNHLHFSILKNGEYVNPMDYVTDPKS